jgi:hypothetical protein
MRNDLKNRLPRFAEIIPVYSVIAALVYGWELYRFAYRVPSWLHYLTMGELFGIFSYAMLLGLVESLLILGLLLGVCALLPARFFKDVFIPRGTAISLTLLGLLITYLVIYEKVGPTFIDRIEIWSLATLALTVLFAWLLVRVRFLSRAMSWLSDRMIVFLFLLMPLSVIGVLTVILRNIF